MGNEEPSNPAHDGASVGRRILRLLGYGLIAFVVLTAGWWGVGRITADSRRLVVRRVEGLEEVQGRSARAGLSAPRRIRVLTWNIAHGRGDVGYGILRNFRGGDVEARRLRLSRIAEVIRSVDPDVVVLNEVDFQASWSGGVNQAEILARSADFETWVEQRNYDLQLPFGVLEFGNALLTSLPLDTAMWLDIPPHRWIEALAVGAKAASLIRLEARGDPLGVIPFHLEVRGVETRMGSVPVLERVRERERAPLILAGDFNAAPPAWPQTGDRAGVTDVDTTVVGTLLERGWTSLRARGSPTPGAWTYPMPRPDRAIDWVLVEPPLEVVEARVLDGTEGLSDHAPVLAVVRMPGSGD